MPEHKIAWKQILASLFGRNWITLFGSSLTTVSALCLIGFVFPALAGIELPVYIGIMVFMVLPGVFIAGLLLVPAGHLWERFKAKRKWGTVSLPLIDLNARSAQHALGILIFLTIINLSIVSSVSYKAVAFMDSVEFCGTVCHTVMEPEFTAYNDSPHSRVECVECHIGPGASWFVRSKLSGVRQVFAVTLDTYSTPIPSPVEHLRPSRETCEQCHWPQRFTGDRVKVIKRFAADETNTPETTVLLMHIGGGRDGGAGIHSWHIDPDRQTQYLATDGKRQEIKWVKVTHLDGTEAEFKSADFELTEEAMANGELRTMDCMDCHNRPSHSFEVPNDAMDKRIARGMIDASLPYIKKMGVEALEEAVDQAEPKQFIADKIQGYYKENYPDLLTEKQAAVDAAVTEIQGAFGRNVFPAMNVKWSTYPLNIGHTDFPGCFRCHDESHTNAAGETISGDCMLCHTPLAIQENAPEILTQLGIQ